MRRLPFRKRASHAIKTGLYTRHRLDVLVDSFFARRLAQPGSARFLLEAAYRRLYPERRLRESPFAKEVPAAHRGESILVLSLVPPEDTGGGSRPALLAAELHDRGFSIDWVYVLPIFPWPRDSRPALTGVSVRHLGEACVSPSSDKLRLTLLEAPHPGLYMYAQRAGIGAPLVYDAIDVWSTSLGDGWYDAATERRVLAAADHLVASSKLIHDEIEQLSGRGVSLLPNAVDDKIFDPTVHRDTPIDVRRGRPTVIYVGALWGDWVDLDLVAKLARALPDATIHLVGPHGERALPTASNVLALGARPRQHIAAYLQAADVAIIPFRPSRLSAAVSPLKAYEYVAMQRPVVSIAVRDVEGIPGVVTVESHDAFIEAVRTAAQAPYPERAAREFIRSNTWSARIDRLLDLVDDGASERALSGPTGSIAGRRRITGSSA